MDDDPDAEDTAPHETSPRRWRTLLVGAWCTSVLVSLAGLWIAPQAQGFIVVFLLGLHVITLALFGQYDRRARQDLVRIEGSERRLRAVIETATDGFLVIDAEGRISRANRAAGQLFGRSDDGLIGAGIDAFVDLDTDAVIAETARATVGRGADGRVFPAEVSIGSRFGDDEQVWVVRDVTERTRAAAELAHRAEALLRSNRELERFAYVASHDLQEPLRTIQAFGSLLDESARDRLDPEEQQALDYLIDAATRQRTLINDLLAYTHARTRPRRVRMIDLDAVLSEVLDALTPTIAAASAVIETTPLPRVAADRGQMHELLHNLVANALKYASDARPPRIVIDSTPLDDRDPPGTRLRITDNGIGFEDRFAERIFEPFRRLHPRHAYPGSGVGLAICRQIVERHDGVITARGTPDGGATFTVDLPLGRIEGGSGGRG